MVDALTLRISQSCDLQSYRSPNNCHFSSLTVTVHTGPLIDRQTDRQTGRQTPAGSQAGVTFNLLNYKSKYHFDHGALSTWLINLRTVGLVL